MSEMPMVERVARAICKSTSRDPDRQISVPHAGRKVFDWESFIDAARAAIQAMREPTAEMLNGPLPAHSSITGIRYESRRDLRPIIYRAMVDAALAVPEEGREP